MTTGKCENVTEKVPTTFIDTDDDHNFDKPSTPSYGWSRDGKFVLLSDGWDIWQVGVNGNGSSTAINLTVNGKKDGIRYRGVFQFEPEFKPGTDLTRPVYTSLYGEWTKKDGIGRIDPSKPGVNVLLWGDCAYGNPMKARNAEVFAFTKQTAVDYPDYYLTDATFKDAKKVTDANPQQKDYLWTAGTKLIEYKGVDGKRLQGTLLLPANYEPGKKYPTIVYIYEKLSQGTHRYNAAGNLGDRSDVHVERLRGADAGHHLPAQRPRHVRGGVRPARARRGGRHGNRRRRQARPARSLVGRLPDRVPGHADQPLQVRHRREPR